MVTASSFTHQGSLRLQSSRFVLRNLRRRPCLRPRRRILHWWDRLWRLAIGRLPGWRVFLNRRNRVKRI
jgi:hypothetical protein